MKKIWEAIKSVNWKGISPATVARYILGIISVINVGLLAIGKNPIEITDALSTNIFNISSMILAILMIMVNTYKNNATSLEGQIADSVLRVLKNIDPDSKEKLINKIEYALNEAAKELDEKEVENDTIEETDEDSSEEDSKEE